MRPTPQQIRDLRTRHRLSQEKLAESLYHIKATNIAHWENGRRNCQPIVWWAMVLTWDKKDLWAEERERVED